MFSRRLTEGIQHANTMIAEAVLGGRSAAVDEDAEDNAEESSGQADGEAEEDGAGEDLTAAASTGLAGFEALEAVLGGTFLAGLHLVELTAGLGVEGVDLEDVLQADAAVFLGIDDIEEHLPDLLVEGIEAGGFLPVIMGLLAAAHIQGSAAGLHKFVETFTAFAAGLWGDHIYTRNHTCSPIIHTT
jgi:hypothetical protein